MVDLENLLRDYQILLASHTTINHILPRISDQLRLLHSEVTVLRDKTNTPTLPQSLQMVVDNG